MLRARLLSEFSCLGDRCEDTCCQNWSMQADTATLNRYRSEAPELMAAVEQGEDGAWIMRKDPASGFCVKLENGLCGIHKARGETFLGDACYFYPRVTRALGDQVVMSATMSCPQIVRLALESELPCALEEADAMRLPQGMKDYLPPGLPAPQALAVHQAFLDAAQDENVSAERIFLRIASASRSLERIGHDGWPVMAAFYLKNADARIPLAEQNPADPFNLLHALCGLIVASRKTPSPRLAQTIADMERALAAKLDWPQVLIRTGDASLPAWQRVRSLWNEQCAARYAPLLRRWLQMQLSLALWPFAGFGGALSERVTLLGMRLTIIKLALMCNCSINGPSLPQDVVVRVMQSLSRLLDHLADPPFSLSICAETGWDRESRMRGLLDI